MAISCIMKTCAFVSALISIAVLSSSAAVLISSIIFPKANNDTVGDVSQSDRENNRTNPPPTFSNNDTVIEQYDRNGEIPRGSFNPNMTTHALSGTNTSASLLNKEERNNVSETMSVSTSPASILYNTTTTTAFTSFLNSTDDNVDVGLTEEPADSYTPTTTIPTHKFWNAFSEQQRDFWEAKSDTYVILIQASSGTGIFAALLQLGFSWLLICSSAKDLKDRTALWNLSNFIVLILAAVIILVPLSYNPANNTFKGTGVFWREIWRKVNSVELSTKTLEVICSSIPNFLTRDLTLYYYVLGVDAFVLIALLVPHIVCCFCTPCFTRCCCKRKSGKSESDLMLFGGTGGGGGGTIEDRY